MITIIGWPRSGTHWLKAMLEHALGEELAHSHACPETEGEYVLIIRDPRDAFASHWRLYQGDHPGEHTQSSFVDYFMRGQMSSHEGWNIGWVPHTRKLLELGKTHPLVRYERMYMYPERTLVQVSSALQRAISLQCAVKAVLHTREQRCDPSTFPVDEQMGRPGKWRSQLSPEAEDALLDYCGPLMTELGMR